jgi:hypothetical protein
MLEEVHDLRLSGFDLYRMPAAARRQAEGEYYTLPVPLF